MLCGLLVIKSCIVGLWLLVLVIIEWTNVKLFILWFMWGNSFEYYFFELLYCLNWNGLGMSLFGL